MVEILPSISLIFSILIGGIPSFSMALGSFIIYYIGEATPLFEATAQNFCAGLILGAVGMELFPLINCSGNPKKLIGVSVGFSFGLLLIHFLDYFVTICEQWAEKKEEEEPQETDSKCSSCFNIFSSSSESSGSSESSNILSDQISYQNTTETTPLMSLTSPPKQYTAETSTNKDIEKGEVKNNKEEQIEKRHESSGEGEDQEEDEQEDEEEEVKFVDEVVEAMSSPIQRDTIRQQIYEVMNHIHSMEDKAQVLYLYSKKRNIPSYLLEALGKKNKNLLLSSTSAPLVSPSYSASSSYNEVQLEWLADELDAAIHQLQYNLDHCRRLFHGSYSISKTCATSRKIRISENEHKILIGLLQSLLKEGGKLLELIDMEEEEIEKEYKVKDNKDIESKKKKMYNDKLTKLYLKLDFLEEQLMNIHHLLESYNTSYYKWRFGHRHWKKRSNMMMIDLLYSTEVQGGKEGAFSTSESDTLPIGSSSTFTFPLSSFSSQHTHHPHHPHHAHPTNTILTLPQGNLRDIIERESISSLASQNKSFIPYSLMIPVLIDCIIDGILLGTSAVLSPKAGYILSFATSIEMGMLGIALSLRIRKCLGIYNKRREEREKEEAKENDKPVSNGKVYDKFIFFLLLLPPLFLFFSTFFGLFLSSILKNYDGLWSGCIGFGVVMLLYLVINELIVEAREVLQDIECWWSPLVIFCGIFCVLVMDTFTNI